MKYSFLICMLAFSCVVFSKTKSLPKGEHREHHAHVHGQGSVNLAFDELKGRLEFDIPTESIVGFEYTAKTEKDKKTVAESIKRFETNISKMVQFDPALNCQFSKDKIEVGTEAPHDKHKGHGKKGKHTGEHSDFEASFNITCDKSVIGSQISFNFSEFPNIKKINLTLLAGNIQKSVELGPNVLTINVK